MKKHVLIIGVLALLSFSCSTEDVAKSQESNLSLKEPSSMNKILSSAEFKDYLNTTYLQKNTQNKTSSKGNNNGLMILSDGFNVSFAAIIDWSSFIAISGEGTIEKLPNGKAKFSVHTNSPDAFYLDFSTWSQLSSGCVDSPLGSLNYNYISEYDTDSYEHWLTGELITIYFPTGENSSTESGNGHCRVSDATMVYNDDFTEIIDCGEATFYKTIKLTGNGKKGFTLSLK
jgi:hypothetical protein